MFIKNSQQDIDFNIPTTLFNVGIKISGGADSGMLCYILAKYKAEERPEINIHPLTVVNIIKPYQIKVSKRVIEFCEKEFNIKFAEHQTCEPAMEGPDLLVAQDKLVEDTYKAKIIDCHTVGVTANPYKDESTLHLFNDVGFIRDPGRDRDGILKPTVFIKDNNPMKSFRPFANIDKKGIFELYQHFGLMDTLFPLTKSCEGYTASWDAPHCGECWWCMERQWGFGRLI